MTEDRAPTSARAGTALDLAIRQTGLAFQRTRLAAERTLMAVVRTALALVSFGFTIFTFFRTLHSMDVAVRVEPIQAAARFGLALVVLGVGTLVFGIWDHARLMGAIRAERSKLIEADLLFGKLPFNAGALLTACALLALGLIAAAAMILRAGPLR